MAYSGRTGMRNTSKRLPRHLRNEDLPRDAFTPRTYQVELLDSARKRNTMVCMGSSSGRMFIAVMLLKEMSSEIRKPLSDGGKRSVYLVNTDEQVIQQFMQIQHPLNVTVGAITTPDDCQQTENSWTQQIQRSEVLIMTGTLFLQLLQQSVIGLKSVNLLVIDDCHLTLQEEHPYRAVMAAYKATPTDCQPCVLGLTSNILHGQTMNPENLGDLVSSLEEALQATAETSTLVISERYGLRVKEKVIECEDYEDTTGLNQELYGLLEGVIDFLEECNIAVSEEVDHRDPRLIAKAALIECHNILTQLGPWCAACLADMLVSQLEKIEKQKESNPMHKRFFKLAATTLRMISTIFDNHFKQCEYSIEELLKYSTPKVTQLMDCLRKYRPETDFIIISEEPRDIDNDPGSDTDMSDDDLDLSDDDDDPKLASPKQVHVAVKKLPPEDELKASDPFLLEEDKYLCGIVFVENQHEAYALNKFIEEVCSWDEGLCFVKSCHITCARTGSGRRLYRRQEDVLRRFRMQELNLLVATSTLEEGVDVPRCNLVVRFDAPRTYRSYSQSKGRARARDAEYIILIEEELIDEFQAQLKAYKQIEEVLIRQCNKSSEESAVEVGDPICDSIVPPYVPSEVESHVKVTLETAIMLVNRYCAKLPSDAFTHLTPACTVMEVQREGQVLYQASLRLPINSPIKYEIQGPIMSTRLKARQAVALKMCEVLHKEGELDNQMMPVGKEMLAGEDWEEEDLLDEEEDQLGEARPGTTKRKQYYCKKVASALLQNHPMADSPCYLYIISMKLTGAITEEQNTRGRKIYAPEDTRRGFGILTSKPIPLVPMFPVFTRSGEVTVSVALQQGSLVVTESQLTQLHVFHHFLFSNVLRLEKDPMDFQPREAAMGYIVVPINRNDGEFGVEIDWEFCERVGHSISSSGSANPHGEVFQFRQEAFEDAVVMPSYRNIDQPQYFYVAEIRHDLNPQSPFPSPELYKTFAEYYTTKYGLTITSLDQPLLDVDHTSARLNLLIPRYMNQKGVPLPTSSAETKKARRENLQQKQILVPELCDIHVFPASLWKKAVCLPAILYRTNYLLLAEEIRKHVAKETKIGVSELPDGFKFPRLDFGFDTSPESLKQATAQNSTEKTDSDKDGADTETDEDADVKEVPKDTGSEESISIKTKELSEGDGKCKSGANSYICDKENSTCNISDIETVDLANDQADHTEPKCNINGRAATGHIEFDIYATDDKRNKFCDKLHSFIDPDLTFQSAASSNKPFMPEMSGRSDGTEDTLTCDVCSLANQEYKGLGITDLVLTSCPKCSQIKSFDTVEIKPKIIELEDDAKLPEAKPKRNADKLDLINGISDVTNDKANELIHKPVGEQNGFAEEFVHDSYKNVKTKKISSNEMNEHESEAKQSLSRENMISYSQNSEIEIECCKWNEAKTTVEMEKNKRNDNLTAAAQCQPNGGISELEGSWQNISKVSGQDSSVAFCFNDISDAGSESLHTDGLDSCDKTNDKNQDKTLPKVQTNSVTVLEQTTDAQTADSETDIFSNVGKFMPEKEVADVEDEYDDMEGPLISLDQDKDLSTFIGPSPCDILQALTMSNANDFFSLERLETIGDSFLKYAITVYLYCSYPGIHEGKLSYLRSKQVSNYNLYRLGKRKGLAECMISTKFEPYENWLPPGFVINENKRKGPVPKVQVVSLNKNISMIFSSPPLEIAGGILCVTESGGGCHGNQAEPTGFMGELEAAEGILRAKEEEFAQGDRPDPAFCTTPYSLQLHHCLPDKSIADCVEALIGCYLTSCDKMAALLFMSWMGLKVLPRRTKETDDPNEMEYARLPCPKSPFLSGARDADLVLAQLLNGYELFEQKIGYQFHDRSYLLQAFTHASYHYNCVTDCYQRLEFLGDAVLDYVITRHLYEDSDKYSPGVLTDLRSALVNNNIFAALAVKWDFHKYFKAISPALFNVIEKFVARQKEKEDEIDIEDDETDEDQDKEHVELEVPKALGDIFESVAGAIYLDSGMSLDVVWGVFYKIMKPQINKYLKNIPKSPVRELLEQEPETAKFDKPERTMDGKIRVTVNVVGKGVFTGVGRNYRIAKSAAAKKALKCIRTLDAEGLV